MKKILIYVGITLLFLTGCSNRNDDEYENIQNKIEASFDLKIERAVGTEVDEITLNQDDVIFTITISRDNKQVSGYSMELISDSTLSSFTSYNVDSEKYNGVLLNESTPICVYDYEKKTDSEVFPTDGCNSDEIDLLNEIQSFHDTILNTIEISPDDLINWAQWYSDNN